MSANTVIDLLPVELIEQILSYDNLEIKDVTNFSATCHRFRHVINNNNTTWRRKFFYKWPQFKAVLGANFQCNWEKETRLCANVKRQAIKLLSDMSPKFYKRYELSDADLADWRELIQEHERAYYYVVDELMAIVNDESPINTVDVVPIATPGNKTLKYYGIKALRFIRQLYLTSEWETYMSLPAEMQVLERGAVLVAQWCQPAQDVTLRTVSVQFDEIAAIVKDLLKTVNPNHPLFAATPDQLSYWATHNLDDNQWKTNDCKQIIEAMGTVLFKNMGFHGNNEMYFMPENSFINEVLEKKRGLPITLAILYESIARRLGVKCEAISFPAHFLLRWNESYATPTDATSGESFYIDVFNKGQFILRGTCSRLSYDITGARKFTYSAATARQVVERMANNLELSGRQHLHPNGRITRLRSTLELLHLVSPTDMTCVLNLSRIYMLYNMDVQQLMLKLTEMQPELDARGKVQANQIVQMLQDHEAHNRETRGDLYPKPEAGPRPANLSFAVGMVMQHQGLNYRCVIYDWDPMCLASEDWQEQMSVATLKFKDQQPFYNVLVEDGSHRYVAQENMRPTAETGYLYQNQDLGRHFSHFFESHYVPNAEKHAEYPHDENVRKYYHERTIFGYLR